MNQWKIDDTLFYPLGLFNISSVDRTIFVTWSYDSLVSQIFKKVETGNILTDQFNIPVCGIIKSIILTEYNTLMLLENGEINYFSSFKNIKTLNFAKNVRYLSSCTNGFVIIKIEKEENSNNNSKLILMEHYKDFKNPELINKFKKFDITYDDMNLFDSNWDQDNFTVKVYQINDQNRNFFELIAKSTIESDDIYIFSVNGNVFCLLSNSNDNDYNISTILVVSSDVTNIEYIPQNNILLIFLSCGSIEILFKSELLNLLDRTIYFPGCEIIASTFSNNYYFYSDEERIVKVEFYYDQESNKLEILEEDQFLSGVVAFTWVNAISKLVCLSENNIFYRAKFSLKSKKSTCPSSNDFNELTVEKFKIFEKNKQLIISLLEEPKYYSKLIEDEINKQTIISIVDKKDLYSKLINCSIEFQPFLTSSNLKGNIIYPTEKIDYDVNSFFGIIKIDIQSNVIFFNNNWNILIYYDIDKEKHHINNIKLSTNFTKNPIIIILHLKKSNLLIPKLQLELNTVIKCDDDINYISIPIEIQNQNITKLFQNAINTIEFRTDRNLKENVKEIFKQNYLFNKDFLNEQDFIFIKKTPILITCSEICEWFNFKTKIDVDDEITKFVIYFFGIKINVEYNDKENLLKITTQNPVALYYCKMLVAEMLSSDYYEELKFDLKEEIRTLLTLQAEIQNGEEKNLNQLLKIYSTLHKKSNL